jgi:hypothetical protein
MVEGTTMNEHASTSYFPAIICAEFDSPIDALVSLCVPHDEAMNLVAAAWRSGESASEAAREATSEAGSEAVCILATLDGGRRVAALPQADGRWAACNAFLDPRCATRAEAERLLAKRLKRGRRGLVGVLLRPWP